MWEAIVSAIDLELGKRISIWLRWKGVQDTVSKVLDQGLGGDFVECGFLKDSCLHYRAHSCHSYTRVYRTHHLCIDLHFENIILKNATKCTRSFMV